MAGRNNMWLNIDWITIGLYIILVFLGWINIYAAIYNEDYHSILDISQRYGKQLIWIGAASILAFLILIIDSRFYSFFAYPIYGILIFLLLAVLFVGNVVNGARSWFSIGGFALQPSEFAKFATSLALAKFMSSFNFKLQTFRSLLIIGLILFIPAFFILMQNDAGSALVYLSFFLVLYREGLSGIVLFFGILAITLFILTLMLDKVLLVAIMIAVPIPVFYFVQHKRKAFVKVMAILFPVGGIIWLISKFILKGVLPETMIILSALLGGFVLLVISIRKRINNYILLLLVFIGSLVFILTVDYTFENLLGSYQQNRINNVLGISSDPLRAGWNVNQSKIAIGSGGFSGKGFLKGTQTKFDFVPEQSTDFIFCTVGEEWGFVGTFVIVALFVSFLLRLIWLAERQRSSFARIYGYSVVSILFFHVMVNIGMTIGLMPVIGIPLPFFSYGGSSLWSFTILLFIFLRLDASRMQQIV